MRFLGSAQRPLAQYGQHPTSKARLSLIMAAIAVGLVLACRLPVSAQMERPQDDLMAKDVNKKVITVADMVNRGLLVLAREVFDHDEVTRMGQAPPDTKHRGVEFLLFTPGIGATVRIHW